MLLPILFLVSFFCINNAKRAAQKGLSKATWALFTFISFVIGTILACFSLGMIIMFKNPNLITLAQENNRVEMNQFMLQNFEGNQMLYTALIFAGGFGGHLFIRYLLDKRK